MQLWPEHFDLSVDFGDEQAGRARDVRRVAGRRARMPCRTCTSRRGPSRRGAFWNEETFASLSLTDFVEVGDQRAAALEFFGRARIELDRA